MRPELHVEDFIWTLDVGPQKGGQLWLGTLLRNPRMYTRTTWTVQSSAVAKAAGRSDAQGHCTGRTQVLGRRCQYTHWSLVCSMLNHFPHAARPPHPVPSFALIFRDHRVGFATSGLLRLGTRRKGHRWRTVEVSDCPRWMCGFGHHWLSDLGA
jgi:hypothetical protein